jgi:hypothetical protein
LLLAGYFQQKLSHYYQFLPVCPDFPRSNWRTPHHKQKQMQICRRNKRDVISDGNRVSPVSCQGCCRELNRGFPFQSANENRSVIILHTPPLPVFADHPNGIVKAACP